MSELPNASLTWLATHHGVITSARLRDHEAGRATVARLLDAGVLRRLAKGVFVVVTAPSTLEQRCAVLCAAHPHGFVTGPTAGSLAELRRMPRASEIHFAVPHGNHLPERVSVRWRQTSAIRKIDRHVRDDGITVASWARLAFDLAADLRALDHLSVLNQLLDEAKVTAEGLRAMDRRLGHPARPGSGRFRRSIEALGSSPANQSHPEVVLARALRRRGVPVEHQTRVLGPTTGRPLRLDLAVRDARWGVELDIHPEHRSLEGHAADAERRREMHRMAWQIETVTEHDMRDVERLADDLSALYLLRRRQLLDRPSVS